MSYKEYIIPKKYTLGEVAKYCGVNSSKINYWSKIFKLEYSVNKRKKRIFTEKDLKFYLLLKKQIDKKYYTLKGIEKLIIPEILKKL